MSVKRTVRKISGFLASCAVSLCSMYMLALNAFAEGESGAAAGASDAQSTAGSGSVFFNFVLPLVLMFVIIYFMIIRPQKKQDQALKDMQNSLEIGDEIVTRDGIIGMVVRINSDNLVIETGGDRNKIRIKTWAVSENVSADERAKASAPKKTANPLESAGLSPDETAGGDKKEGKKKSK